MQEIPNTRTLAFDTQNLPLAGKRVLITRTREQASALNERLRSAGASCVEFPTIQIVPPQDWGDVDAALQRLYAPQEESYNWLILTSANGVKIFFQRLEQLGYRSEDLQSKQHVRIATIGPATAATLKRYHVQADLAPEAYIAEGVIAALLRDAEQRGTSLIGKRILFARAAEARRVLVTDLQQAGALVDEVVVYYTLPVASNDTQGQEVLRLLRNRQLDIATFTSSSTVRNFVAWLRGEEADSFGDRYLEKDEGPSVGAEGGDKPHPYGPRPDRAVGWSPKEEEVNGLPGQGQAAAPTDSQIPISLLREVQIASIGPITSQTAHELGLHVDIEAKEFTIDGLVDAIIKHKELSC